jgi:hypothetical protein
MKTKIFKTRSKNSKKDKKTKRDKKAKKINGNLSFKNSLKILFKRNTLLNRLVSTTTAVILFSLPVLLLFLSPKIRLSKTLKTPLLR